MTEQLIAFASVILVISIVVTACLEILQKLVPFRYVVLRLSLARLLDDLGASVDPSETRGLLRPALEWFPYRLLGRVDRESWEGARRLLEEPLLNPSGARFPDRVNPDALDIHLREEVLAPVQQISPERFRAWFASFEAGSTLRLKSLLAVIGVLVAYMGCHAIGVDAYSLSRAWRSDPWQAAVVAWDSGDQASSVRVSAAFSDRLGSEIPCLQKLARDRETCRQERLTISLRANVLALSSTNPYGFFQTLRTALQTESATDLPVSADRRKAALAVASDFASDSLAVLADPTYSEGVGLIGAARREMGRWILALLGSLGAPFWFDLLQRIRGYRSSSSGASPTTGKTVLATAEVSYGPAAPIAPAPPSAAAIPTGPTDGDKDEEGGYG